MDKYFTANAVLSVFCKNYMELKKGLPIRPSEMGVLNIITGIPGPHTPVMLAERLRVSKPMITAHITSLTEKGYITREPSSEDKRAYYILPTKEAQELVDRVGNSMNQQLAWLEEAIGQDGFDELVRLAEMTNLVLEANRTEQDEQKK